MSDLVTQLRAYQARVIRFASWPDRDGKNPEEVGWTISEAQTNALMLEAANAIERLTAERDEARAQEEKFSDDALRLLIERNRALDERDEARREVCGWAGQARNLDPNVIAMQRGWNIKVKHEPDAKHDRPEEVVLVKVGRHRVRELKR